jgi:protein-disulfide isomerase
MAKLHVAVSGEDHSQGDENAELMLVEYGDYQCPDCGMAYPVVKQLQRHYGKRLRFVYRNFPLEMHAMAEPAAEAAEFAGAEGKFWEMHDAIFTHQKRLSETMLMETTEGLGLDGNAAAAAIEDQKFGERIERDMEGGEKSGVHGTPTFFINGKEYEADWEFEEMVAAMDAAV